MQPDQDRSLPSYSYVPGGPWPHPISSSNGHWAGLARVRVAPIEPGGWAGSNAYLRGIELFNAGYYWEAHEVWEGLWHAHGRSGATADVIKALIKLAAAGVKVRERQPHGIITHAGRAARLFESARGEGGNRQLGLDLGEWAAIARKIADDPPVDSGSPDAAVSRVFEFSIVPVPNNPNEEQFTAEHAKDAKTERESKEFQI